VIYKDKDIADDALKLKIKVNQYLNIKTSEKI
jgi:hypothetical protein